jgi:thiamine-monophosphate kinase
VTPIISATDTRTVADVGEKWIVSELIAPICGMPPSGLGIGDDAAVIDLPLGSQLVTSTDKVPEDLLAMQFGLMDPYRHGRYLAEVNLSDISAMGATPIGLLLCLALPRDTTLHWLAEFVRGFSEAGRDRAAPVFGGDTGWGSALTLSATALGAIAHGAAIRRHGASPGDKVFVSGQVGGFGAALLYWASASARTKRLDEVDEGALKERLLEPRARVELGSELATIGTVSTMMDVTDGLGSSLRELATASSARLVIDADALPLFPQVLQVSRLLDLDPVEIALGIGLDLELLGCLRPDAEPPEELTVIGEVITGDGVGLLRDGVVSEAPAGGWQHFSGDALAQLRTILAHQG